MRKHYLGFTLIEMLIVVALIGILAAVSLPSYRAYVTKQKVISAQSDLTALALNMENAMQQQLAYPTTGVPTSTTSGTQTLLWPTGTPGWVPAQAKDFTYIISSSTATTYVLTATGTSSGLTNCTVTLTNANVRTLTSGCGGSTSWF